MTASMDFDRMVVTWLDDVDRTEMPSASIDAALTSARRQGQRRGLRAAIAGAEGWPVASRDVRLPRISVRRLLITAVLLALAVATVVGIGALLAPKTPLGGGGWITVTEQTAWTHVIASDGSGVTRRTGQYCPHLTPDGEALAYRPRFGPLYVEPLDGGDRRNLGSLNNFGYADGLWSPDGTRLAYNTTNDNGEGGIVQALSILDGSRTTLLEPDGELAGEAWSPDSQRIAIAYVSDRPWIDIVDMTGARASSIAPIAVRTLGSMHWSPDGSRLAMVSGTSPESAALTIIDLETGSADEIMTGSLDWPWPIVSPWSADGQWLAVANGGRTVSIVRADGSGRTDIPLAQPIVGFAGWSPVENVVAVTDSDTLVTVRADGSGRIDRPFGTAAPDPVVGGGEPTFAWSPDGSRLVFVALDMDSDQVEVILHAAADASSPLVVRYDPPLDPVPGPRALRCIRWVPPPSLETP